MRLADPVLLCFLAACGSSPLPAIDDAGVVVGDAGFDHDTIPSTTDAAVDASAPNTVPSGVGPYAVARSTEAVSGWTVNVFDPKVPSNVLAPIVLFKHGFQLGTSNYATSLTQLASHGYVVLGVDSQASLLNGPTQAEERDGLIAALDWALAKPALAGHVDAKHTGVAGHSRGGKIAVMAAAKDARITAVLGLDAVNGCGPNAMYSSDCPDITSNGFAASLSIPAGYMGETADGQGFMACAPAAQNYSTIYTASSKASWAAQWTFPGAAHMTFTDDGGGVFGSFCMKASGNESMLRDDMRTLAVAFFDRHLRGDLSRDAWLIGMKVPAPVQVVHK